ncbi:MAG: ABC transporter permease [Eubacteriales bacterium]|nr:ABC transporter permease [Eubacteriales bacterium]MDY3332472.1 ABC transporter permease [Gallibacter sp.]
MKYVFWETTMRILKGRKFSTSVTAFGVTVIVMTITLCVFLTASIKNFSLQNLEWNIANGILSEQEYLYLARSMREDISTGGILFSFPTAIILMVILASGLLLLINAYAIALNKRISQYRTFYLVGATDKQLRRATFYENIYVANIAIPAGIILGLLATKVIIYFLSEQMTSLFTGVSDPEMPFYFDMGYVIMIAIISLLMVIVASLITTYNINSLISDNISKLTIKRKSNKQKKKEILNRRRLSYRLFSIEGVLAKDNFLSNKSQYRYAITSMIFSTVIFLATSIIISYLKTVVASDFGVKDYGEIAKVNNWEGYMSDAYYNVQVIVAFEILSYGFVILMAIVALANVCNTISGAMEKRKNEFKTLMTIGMTKSQIRKMMIYECILFGIDTLVYSGVSSMFVLITLSSFLLPENVLLYNFPYFEISVSILIVISLIILTAIYVIARITTQNSDNTHIQSI